MKKEHILLGLILFLLPLGQISFGQEAPKENAKSMSKDEEMSEIELDVVLGIDLVQKLEFMPYTKISVGNEQILTYQIIPQKREIIFKGLRAGQTSVIIRDTIGDIKARFKINVTTNSQSQTVSELREFLGDVEGLDIGIKGGKVYVGGEIIVPNDIGKISTVLAKYDQVIQLFELSPHTQIQIGKKMQEELRKAGLKDVTVRVVNKVYWLEGVVTSNDEKTLAMNIAEGYIPDRLKELASGNSRLQTVKRAIIQNFLTVNEAKSQPPPPKKMIKIIAQFVELSKEYNKIFGFKWTPTLATGGGAIQFGKTMSNGVTTKSSDTLSGTISNLFPKLASAKSAGYARVIQQGMIITQDGEKANIKKSSSIPFILGTGEFQRPLAANTGFNLEVKPVVEDKELIKLGIGVTVKMSHGQNGETDNNLQTIIGVKNKESAVIGGISINEGQTSYDKDPPFGVDQVDPATGSPLFSFLRSKSYAINKSQFVVFITPEIIASASTGTNEIKRKFKQRRR